ncbi:MAG TPA: hypothetical protein VGP07_17040 [Polyangia bacterium]
MTVHLDASLAALRQSFAVATFSDGGLLLHLPSGDFFELDAESAAAWSAITGTATSDQTVAVVAEARALSHSSARALVERAVTQGRAVTSHPPSGIPRFEDDGPLLSLRDGEQIALSFDRRSLVLSATTSLRDRSDDDVAAALRVFVPKIFGGWYPLALHASAVELAGRVVLFSGDSGAGKTTTARVLADEIAGCRLLGEDVVLSTEHAGALMMVHGAEVAIQEWMNEATAALVTRRAASVEVRPLREALAQRRERLPLHKIVFLDAARRRGAGWSFAPLAPSSALRSLFVHSFIHSSDATALRAHLAACRRVVDQLTATEAVAIPAGLDDLRTSSRAQIETIAS